MQTRSTFNDLSGGDRIQLERTATELRKLGHAVTIEHGRYRRNLKPFDVVHLFNMQIEPHCFLVYLLQAERAAKPVALSTIYWNPDQWKANLPSYDRDRGPSKRQIVRNLLRYKFRGISPGVVLGYLLRSGELRRWLWLATIHPGSGQATHFIKTVLVARADIVLPNGQSEADLVVRDFGRPRRVAVVPNGADDEFASSKASDFTTKYGLKDFVLSVGRIETRKNTLALVRAAQELDLPLVLIGNDQIEPSYTAEVRRVGGSAVKLIPQMEHRLLGSAYKAARIHALVSWFETPGLSSLEAAMAGCTIVTTKIGTAREYFGDLAHYCDPADYASIKRALKQAMAAPRSAKLRDHILTHFTWRQAALATERAYRSIGAGS